MLGRVGLVKALTPKEHYLCPETADMLGLVSASNLEKKNKTTVLRVILTEWRTIFQTRKNKEHYIHDSFFLLT